MRVTYLGCGTWGFAIATLLAEKGHNLHIWTRNEALATRLNRGGDHPNLPGHRALATMQVTTDLREALEGTELLVEAVTAAGIRPVFEQVVEVGVPDRPVPIVITSKGIEQKTGLLLANVVLQVIGEDHRSQMGCLSGPSHAEEVIRGLPTTVVCSAFEEALLPKLCDAFVTPNFRVYPNSDIIGVEFGGAMKNIAAIASGISDGLGFGDNTKAALITRGLHEMRKLGQAMGCRPETLNGLAGLGDLIVTCTSPFSRNYRFGRALAEGMTPDQARKKIGMVVEGAYSCVAVLPLAKKYGVPLPIAEAVYQIIYEGLALEDAVSQLMERRTKEEHL